MEFRQTREADLDRLVTLMDRSAPGRGWGRAKWNHYYRDYPEGPALSIIAVDGDEILGHFGALPVRVSGLPAMFTHHVLVSPEVRDIAVIQGLFKAIETAARESGVSFVAGVPNAKLAPVAQFLCGWKTIGYFVFTDVAAFDPADFGHCHRPSYGPDWLAWKFGPRAAVPVTNTYETDGRRLEQLLKSGEDPVRAGDLGTKTLNLWSPATNTGAKPGGWAQAFYFKPLVDDLPNGLGDIGSWFFELGDSDAVEVHRPWEILPTRLATMADSDRVLAWRNDPLTRSMFFDGAPVAPEAHRAWFEKALEDENRVLVIGGEDGETGIVRFDVDGTEAEVSLNLNPARRGNGLGARLLSAAERHLDGRGVEVLVAEIKDGNTASRKAFARAGYEPDGTPADTKGAVRYVKAP